MAMPPTAAAAPPMDDMAPAGGDAPADMPMDDAAPEGEVVATIMRMPDGTYSLTAGDEMGPGEPAEAGEAPAPEPQMFDTPQALLKGVMMLLNDSGAAEDSFAKGFKGEPDPMMDKAPAKPMM